MSTLLLIWLVLGFLVDHVLAVMLANVKSSGKRALYLLLVVPYLAVTYLALWLGRMGWFAALSTWFKS